MSSEQAENATSEPRSLAQDIPGRATDDPASSSSPVEMNSLKTDKTIGNRLEQQDTQTSNDSASKPPRPMRSDTTTAIQNSQNPLPPPVPALPSPKLDRSFSTAIGPSTDGPVNMTKDAGNAGPTLMITLLLLSGARHPFNLDAAYLAKRNVTIQDNDPFNLSVYKVKELILREWRSEWESKPSSPSAIRLIHFGKVLDDKTAIKELRFQPQAANVVHMSIKPQDFIDEEDAKASKATRSQSHDGDEGRSPGCRCIIM